MKTTKYILAALILVFGLALIREGYQNKPASSVEQTNQITYQGQDGKNALEILKSNYQVATSTSAGLGEFVNEIDGVKPGQNQYWAFYVNGSLASVGADSYVTRSGDNITWKLESF